ARPFTISGTAISDRADSTAERYRGSFRTSPTSTGWRVCAAVPVIPFPTGILQVSTTSRVYPMANRKCSSCAASSSSSTAKISYGTSRRTSSAAFWSTWSRSSEEFTSSAISSRIAKASAETSTGLSAALASIGNCVSFRSMNSLLLDSIGRRRDPSDLLLYQPDQDVEAGLPRHPQGVAAGFGQRTLPG